MDQVGDDLEQSRLAAARRPADTDVLPGLDHERHPPKRRSWVAGERVGHVDDGDGWLTIGSGEHSRRDERDVLGFGEEVVQVVGVYGALVEFVDHPVQFPEWIADPKE